MRSVETDLLINQMDGTYEYWWASVPAILELVAVTLKLLPTGTPVQLEKAHFIYSLLLLSPFILNL